MANQRKKGRRICSIESIKRYTDREKKIEKKNVKKYIRKNNKDKEREKNNKNTTRIVNNLKKKEKKINKKEWATKHLNLRSISKSDGRYLYITINIKPVIFTSQDDRSVVH